MKNISIDYDNDYGIDHRKGWSVSISGVYVVEFKKSLLVALIIAIYETW